MAKQIRRQDVVEDDIFKVTRESAQETLVVLDKLNAEFKESAKVLKEDISKATLDSAKSIETFVKSTEKATKLKTDSIKVDEQTIRVKQQLAKLEEMEEKRRLAKEKADGQAITNSQKLQREEERKAKATERAAKAAKDEASAYKQLEKNTRELKNQSKELAAQMLLLERNGQKNTKQYRELSAEYKKVTAAAQQGDQALKKIDSTVGDNFRNVGNYTGAIDKLRNGLGQLGLAFGIGSIVRSAGQTVLEFDQKIADLVSITGASGESLELFKEQSVELGKSVEGGASAVIEAYKLIGSAKPELLENAEALNEVTKAAITLSQASGMELPDAATALTDAMNQFGAPAEDAAKFIDALANGALFGAAEIPQVTDALLKFGAVANTANVSIEESTGLIETLAEKGLKGAEAGTALRNVMLKLSAPDALPKEAKDRLDALGVSFEDLQDTSKPFSQRLDALKPLLKDNAALVKVFGTENAVAATNLIRNTDRIKDLTEKMYTQGTASKQAEDRTQTLSFALNKLKETWNGLILSFTEGAGAGKILTGFISFLANNLGTIITLVTKLTIAWGVYKAFTLSLIAIEKLRNTSFKDLGNALMKAIPMTKQYAQAQKDAAEATKEGATASKGLGGALSGIGWTLIISAAWELGSAFWDIASGAARAREQAERLDNYRAKASETAQKNITKETEALDKQLRQRQRDLQVAQSQAKTEAEKQRLEKENAALRKQDIDNAQKQVKSYRDAAVVRLKSYRAEKAELEELTSIRFGNRTEEQQNRINQIYEELGVTSWTATEKMKDAQDILTAKITASGTKINEYNKGLETMSEMLKDSTTELEVLSNAETAETKVKEKKIKVQKELNTTMAEYNEYLTVQTELLNELEQLQTEGKINALNTEISDLTEELQMLADGGADINTDLIEAKIQQRYALEKALIKQKLDAEIAAINERYRLDALKARETVDKEYQKLINQQGLSPQERLKIETQYQDQLRLLEQDELQRNADKELQLKILNEKANQEEIDLEQKTNDEIIDLKNDLNERILQSEQDRIDKEDENRKKELEKEKQNAEDRIAIINAIAEAAIAASQRRVEQIEKEIAAAQSQADYFKELAANGNIDAKQSLAEQNKIIAEANQKKEAELRKQQRIQFANTVYQTYQKNSSDENVKNPLAKTITDVTLLAEFIKNFPAFLEGTEDTGTNGQGVDGKGGFHAILHPNERVMTKEQNAMVGDLSNESLAKLAQEYNAGSVITKAEGAVQLGGAWSTAAVIKKLDELEQALKSKPETNIELGEIIDGAMTIVKTKKQGNSVVYNRYKVK